MEIYYEPKKLRKSILESLTNKGWCVSQYRVSVSDELRKMDPDKMAHAAAETHGMSSVTHAYNLGYGVLKKRQTEITDAANGKGTLTN